MGTRLLAVATAKNTTKILKKVLEVSDGEIEHLLHLGDMDADIKAREENIL